MSPGIRSAGKRIATAVVLLVLGAACSSGSGKAAENPTTTSAATTQPSKPTTPTSTRPRAKLEFRAVVESEGRALVIPATPDSQPGVTGSCASLVAKSRKQRSSREEVVFDRKRQNCYVVGPALLTGAAIESGQVVYDSNQSQWVVNVHFGNDDFVTKIAQPYLHRQIAIVLNGVVQSAPIINPGITGRDAELFGQYTRTDAVKAAAAIMGIAPSQVRLGSNG